MTDLPEDLDDDDTAEEFNPNTLTLVKNVFRVTLDGHKVEIPVYGTEDDLDTLSRFITWLINRGDDQ